MKNKRSKLWTVCTKFLAAAVRKCYIGETGRKFGTRLKEHKMDVEAMPQLRSLSPEANVHQVCRINQL